MSTGMLALKLAAMGMGMVFIILSVLGLMIHILKLIFNVAAKNSSNPAIQVTPEASRTEGEAEEELVAVIAAACRFARVKWNQAVIVKAVTPVWDEKYRSPWLEAGRQEIINSRLGLRRAQ